MYSKNTALLNKFLQEKGVSVEQLRVSYEACHGPVEDDFEVQFFRRKTPEEMPSLLSPLDESYSGVVRFNFTSLAEHKEFSRTILMVELKCN